MSFRKIWMILSSRFRKEREEDWIEQRREACRVCTHNSLNNSETSTKKRLLKFLSDLYTKVTFAKYEDLGTCECSCPIALKTRERDEICWAAEEYGDDKWKSIFIPQKSKKKAIN